MDVLHRFTLFSGFPGRQAKKFYSVAERNFHFIIKHIFIIWNKFFGFIFWRKSPQLDQIIHSLKKWNFVVCFSGIILDCLLTRFLVDNFSRVFCAFNISIIKDIDFFFFRFLIRSLLLSSASRKNQTKWHKN